MGERCPGALTPPHLQQVKTDERVLQTAGLLFQAGSTALMRHPHLHDAEHGFSQVVVRLALEVIGGLHSLDILFPGSRGQRSPQPEAGPASPTPRPGIRTSCSSSAS